jgi:uncharacterized membrane protein YbhN (UPF0104 family)
VLRAVGIIIAILAVGFCIKTLAHEWSSIRSSLAHANYGLLAIGLLCALGSMTGLGLLWWRCLQVFGSRQRRRDAIAWYFGGELGKYLPGGIWPVLGRGELAVRSGVSRGTAYLTTLICYAAMCVAAAIVCGVLAPIVALDGHGLSWGWIMFLLIPAGGLALHPAVMRPALALGQRLTKGRVSLQPQSWTTMLGLTAWSIPTWLLAGGVSVAVADALGYHQQPARVAFAAIVAWIVGFLAVPVPAGAGLREVVFVATSGLAVAPAVAVAAIARLLFILVDAGGGFAALITVRRIPAPAAAGPE